MRRFTPSQQDPIRSPALKPRNRHAPQQSLQGINVVAEHSLGGNMVIRLAEAPLNTRFGQFTEVLYYDGQRESIALVMGNVKDGQRILCRVHSSCISGHVFNSIECDCREQMEKSQRLIQREGRGLIIWLDQEGKGNGHLALIKSRPLKAKGTDQAAAYEQLGYKRDGRDFSRAAEIIQDLAINSVTLLTGSSSKAEELAALGINVAGIKPLHLPIP